MVQLYGGRVPPIWPMSHTTLLLSYRNPFATRQMRWFWGYAGPPNTEEDQYIYAARV